MAAKRAGAGVQGAALRLLSRSVLAGPPPRAAWAEHLHAHFGTNPAAVALLVRALGGPPYSFTVHGPDEFDAPVALSLQAKIDAAAFVAAISHYGRSQLMRWSAPEHWGKIKLIRCGVDADFLGARVGAAPAESTEFVCVAARLSAQKGLPLLIAACDLLREDGRETFSVTIVGDGELRGLIEQDIRQRRLDGHVVLAGICSSAEIRQKLTQARSSSCRASPKGCRSSSWKRLPWPGRSSPRRSPGFGAGG